MAEQNRDSIERLQRGLIIALIAIVGILVLVLGFRMLRGGTELLSPISTQTGSSETVEPGRVDALLAEARSAMADSRLVSPAGNNAYENYLAVLDLQPNNVSAREALNDLYGIAVSSAEQAIAAGDIDDAERLEELLERSNPNSFTVVSLGQRIGRARSAIAAAQQTEQQRAQAVADGVAPPPAPEPAPEPEPDPEPASSLASLTAPSTPAATTPPPASPPPVPASPPPATTTTTPVAAAPATPATPAVREARLLSRVDPQYPREAMRGRQQGWVEVEFTIGRDGSVSDPVVVASRPTRVFDRAATRAILDWRFEPRLEDGQPVASRLRQRFDFRLD